MDPYVLAVGAADRNDSVAGWASPVRRLVQQLRQRRSRHVDLVAPGRSIVSLRDPGSYVDPTTRRAWSRATPTGRLFRGSGTSQAAAVVSGAVALLLQAYPNLTPDQVKYLLTQRATPVSGGTALRRCRRAQHRRRAQAGAGSTSLLGKLLGGGLPAATQNVVAVRRAGLDRGGARRQRPGRPDGNLAVRRDRRAGQAVEPRGVVGGVAAR